MVQIQSECKRAHNTLWTWTSCKDAPLEELILEYSFDGVNYTKAIETEAKAGCWVGVKSGMFACHDNSIKTEAGYVTVDYVEYK